MSEVWMHVRFQAVTVRHVHDLGRDARLDMWWDPDTMTAYACAWA